MLKTQAEISRLKGVTRLVISRYIAKNNIQPAGKKGKMSLYDCSQKPLASYLANHAQENAGEPQSARISDAKSGIKPQNAESAADTENQAESVKAAKTENPPVDEKLANSEIPASEPPKPQSSAARAQLARISKPLNDLLAERIPDGQKPSAVFYLKAMKLAEENQDAALLFKLGQIADKEDRDELYQQQMLKTERAKEQIAQEKAERLKIENGIRKGEYIALTQTKSLFGKVYAVHTSRLTSMGLKLADMLAALPESPDRRIKIQEMIDNEIFSALGSVKRLLVEYVKE